MNNRTKKSIIILLICILIIISIATILMININHNTNTINNTNNLNQNTYTEPKTNKNNVSDMNMFSNNKGYNSNDLSNSNSNSNSNNNSNSNSSSNSNSNRIFNIDLNHVNHDKLNSCTQLLYQNIYNKDINSIDIDDFIENNITKEFSDVDKDYNNKIFFLYKTNTLDSLRSFDGADIQFVSLNSITNIDSNYEYTTYTANITYHIIQHPQAVGSTTDELDIQKNDTIKISSEGKLISIISNSI